MHDDPFQIGVFANPAFIFMANQLCQCIFTVSLCINKCEEALKLPLALEQRGEDSLFLLHNFPMTSLVTANMLYYSRGFHK